MIIIAGNVNSDGTIAAGQGAASDEFRVERLDTGKFKVTFTKEFNTTPTVVVTLHGDYSTLAGALLHSSSKSSFQVNTGDLQGNLEYRNFSFIAIGNR